MRARPWTPETRRKDKQGKYTIAHGKHRKASS